MTPLTCGMGSVAPSVQSLLVTVKLGTCGRKSYGLGGVGRSAMAVVSSVRGWFPGIDPRHVDARPPDGTHGAARTSSCDCNPPDRLGARCAGTVRDVPAPGP